jgi:hypothetical protein
MKSRIADARGNVGLAESNLPLADENLLRSLRSSYDPSG